MNCHRGRRPSRSAAVDRCRHHADEHLVRCGGRAIYVLHLDHVRWAVSVPDRRLHAPISRIVSGCRMVRAWIWSPRLDPEILSPRLLRDLPDVTAGINELASRTPHGRSMGPFRSSTPRVASAVHIGSTSSTSMVSCSRDPAPRGATAAGSTSVAAAVVLEQVDEGVSEVEDGEILHPRTRPAGRTPRGRTVWRHPGPRRTT